MTKGTGLQAVGARIAAAFHVLHNDCRDREQMQADLQMAEEIAQPEPPMDGIRRSIEEQFDKIRLPELVKPAPAKPAVEKSSLTYSAMRRRFASVPKGWPTMPCSPGTSTTARCATTCTADTWWRLLRKPLLS
jgi:hypothetical protein